jgi:hypothetical protein
MISIIICSRTKEIETKLFNNIKNSIGCEYELVVIDNSNNKYSIFEAYNIGIKKSNGNYFCFMHDDILMHTQSWGLIIEDIFEANEKLGLVGIAGAKVKTRMPSAWWDCEYENKMLNIVQHFPNGTVEKMNFGFNEGNFQDAIVIDGVFMVMRKIDGLLFSEKLKGFHNYDMNICFEILKRNFKVGVTNDVLIEHYSLGNINKDWLVSAYDIYKQYKNILPKVAINANYDKNLEIRNAKKYINLCYKHNTLKNIKILWFKLFLLKPFMKFNIRCFYTYFKLKLNLS